MSALGRSAQGQARCHTLLRETQSGRGVLNDPPRVDHDSGIWAVATMAGGGLSLGAG